MSRVVTFGEAMGVLRPLQPGPLGDGSLMRLGWAGAEANVAVGLARRGHDVSWVGCLGSDSTGEMVLKGLRGEGVDVSAVRRVEQLATGLLVHEQRGAQLQIWPYRRGLAGAALAPADVPVEAIGRADLLHLTGITPALSGSARDAWLLAWSTAEAAGVPVSLDVNYRSALWPPEEASQFLQPWLTRVNVLFAGRDELAALGLDPAGASERVVTAGADEAIATLDTGELRMQPLPVRVADPVGAGDAFVSGYLHAWLADAPLRERLVEGLQAGAAVTATVGDWEGLPRGEARSDKDVLR